MRHRAWRAGLLLAVALLSWGSAIYVLRLHLLIGPARQPINIRWASGTDDAARQTAETALNLGNGEERAPGTWSYHLQDHSQDTVRQIVTHPLVADTFHINRQAFRIVIDAPDRPLWLRRLLQLDLGPAYALTALAIGLVAVGLARRELAIGVTVIRGLAGVEPSIALALLCLGFVLVRFYDIGQGVDENMHFDQIARLARGDWTLNSGLTMVPGFHALVAALVWAGGGATESSVRFVVFLISVSTVGAFHALARMLQPEEAGTRTLQFTILPILFPQFFLIYTDVTSLLIVLLMFGATVRSRYWLAGALGLLSCLVRQDNVIWVTFAVCWSYLRDQGWTWPPLSQLLTRYWTFFGTSVAFLLFVVANGGQVALGYDAASHPLGAVHFTNIFFLLFLSCFLFLPLWWGHRRDVLALLRNWRTWLALPVLFVVFWVGFVNDHPHNNERGDYFLSNAILMLFSSTAGLKLLFFIPVAVAALCMAAVPMNMPWRLLFPFTTIFLLPEWLVVPRYYLIPLSLFLLARTPVTIWSERAQTILFLAGSTGVFLMIEWKWGWL